MTGWPACMTLEEFELWCAANARAGSQRAPSPCSDCPLSFAIEMRAEDRCNGEPGGEPGEPTPVKPVQVRPPSRFPTAQRYATDEDRILARRRTWRDSKWRARLRNDAVDVTVVEVGGYRATFAIRRDKAPARVSPWRVSA
jgi:hypothetical protein